MKTQDKNIAIKNGEIHLSKRYKKINASSMILLLYVAIISFWEVNSTQVLAGGFNGTGTYNRYYNWTNDKANNINITASRFDTEDNGFATGLSSCIVKDGQQTTTARIPFAVGLAINQGTVSSPGLSVIGDTSSGFYQTSPGSLLFSSGGSYAATMNANGLDNTPIGVGTPQPGHFTTLASLGTSTIGGTLTVVGTTTLGTLTTSGLASLNSATAPTGSAHAGGTNVATQAYVDASHSFGSWSSYSSGTSYQAATDMIVVIYATLGAGAENALFTALTDSSNPPVTTRCQWGNNVGANNWYGSCTLPVKRGDYWEVTTTGTLASLSIYGLPVGN